MKIHARFLGVVYSVLGIVAAVSGCSTIQQQILAFTRQPGEKIETTPDQVWLELNCANRERPFVRIETMEVLPQLVRPGDRVNYRLVYAMCPQKPSEVLSARIVSNMLFKGKSVARKTNDNFEFKPGRWIVDSFFTLPAATPLGNYVIQVDVETAKGPLQKKVGNFVVSNNLYLSER